MNQFPRPVAIAATWQGRWQFTLADLFCWTTYLCVVSALGAVNPWIAVPLVLLSLPIFQRMQVMCPVHTSFTLWDRCWRFVGCTVLEWSLGLLTLFVAIWSCCPIGILAVFLAEPLTKVIGTQYQMEIVCCLFILTELCLSGVCYALLRRHTWPKRMMW